MPFDFKVGVMFLKGFFTERTENPKVKSSHWVLGRGHIFEKISCRKCVKSKSANLALKSWKYDCHTDTRMICCSLSNILLANLLLKTDLRTVTNAKQFCYTVSNWQKQKCLNGDINVSKKGCQNSDTCRIEVVGTVTKIVKYWGTSVFKTNLR